MDHITVPATVRSATGTDAVMLDVGVVDGWVVIADAEAGGPSITVDKCTWQRLVAAGARLGV